VGLRAPRLGARPHDLMQKSVSACRGVDRTVTARSSPLFKKGPFHLRKAEDSGDMAFHQCIECQNLFMAEEKKCPNCGKPVGIPLGRERLTMAALISLVVILGVVGYQLAASQRSDLSAPSALQELRPASLLPPPEEFEPTVHPLEEHYSKLLDFLEQGQFELAAETLSLMRELNGLNYKDTPLLEKKVVLHGLEEDAKRIPASMIADNIAAYQKLLAMDPGNRVYQQKIAYYEARRRELRVQAQARDKRPIGKSNDQKETPYSKIERLVGIPF